MSKMLAAMKRNDNYDRTLNGAVTHKTTESAVLDMFARGGSMRQSSESDRINLFKEAFEEDKNLALKCLFYLRDIRGGQGERKFFRENLKYLAIYHTNIMRKLMPQIPEYGRWDDLYSFVNTPLEKEMFAFMKKQIELDIQCKTPSLLAKWLKSENASSAVTKDLAKKTYLAFGWSPKHYRKILSGLRERLRVVEVLMSENRWDEIEFDKIPSKAGLKYKNAFARRDIIKAKYEKFIKSDSTKVNAKTLYPYEVVAEAEKVGYLDYADVKRIAVNKYWDNLKDYFDKCTFDALPVVDTSGSMWGQPLDVACSLGLYMAERNKGPFYNHYISFSRKARLIETSGYDFVDKVARIYKANLCENTNVESVFDLILEMLLTKQIEPEDLPKNVIIFSDMEFDNERSSRYYAVSASETLMETIANKWRKLGYEMPHLIYWNLNASHANIPMLGVNKVSYISGFSPSIFETLMHGKSGYDLMLDKLLSERYAAITID